MSGQIAAVGGAGSPQVMSGASGYAPPATKMTSLFNQIDSAGAGSITQGQFGRRSQR